jgi:hypothetical protein
MKQEDFKDFGEFYTKFIFMGYTKMNKGNYSKSENMSEKTKYKF